MSKIYHYTTINSLKSIFDNKQLWATQSSLLNDKDELTYFFDLFDKALKLEIEDTKFRLLLRNNAFRIIKRYASDAYVLSFSKRSDKVGLWSSYSSGEGCCLEFCKEKVLETISNGKILNYADENRLYFLSACEKVLEQSQENGLDESESKVNFVRILYGDIDYSRISIIRKLRESIKVWCKLIDECNDDDNFFMSDFYIEDILQKRMFVKRDGFSSEEEFRIILAIEDSYFGRNYEHYRVRNSIIIPYLKLNIIKMSEIVDKIILDPKCEFESAKCGLMLYLNHLKFDKVKVEKSKMNIRY